MKIDKQSPLPIYYQIQQKLKEMMETGKLQPGDKIPSENELSQQFEVSRMTIRQAINGLVEECLLVRHRGLGTFVEQKKVAQDVNWLHGFTEYMTGLGYVPSSETLSFEVKKATKRVAKQLHISEGSPVYFMKRLRYADNIPIALEDTYVPVKLLPKLNESVLAESLYRYVEKDLGYSILYADQSIEAAVGKAATLEMLDAPENTPLLVIEQTTFISPNTPFEYARTKYRADRYKLHMHIERQGTVSPS